MARQEPLRGGGGIQAPGMQWGVVVAVNSGLLQPPACPRPDDPAVSWTLAGYVGGETGAWVGGGARAPRWGLAHGDPAVRPHWAHREELGRA